MNTILTLASRVTAATFLTTTGILTGVSAYATGHPSIPPLMPDRVSALGRSATVMAQDIQQITTVFACVPTRTPNQYATIAKRGNRVTEPMILWSDTSYGAQYTPRKRCQTVSQRLTNAVAANGGKLKQLMLNHGRVSGVPVICYVNTVTETCNQKNLLLTLRSQDAGKERQILQQMINFGVYGTGAPLKRGSGSIPFGAMVEERFNATSSIPRSTPTVPASPSSPLPQSTAAPGKLNDPSL